MNENSPQKPIYVTRPYLPPLEELTAYLEKIWENQVLTNSGPFHQQLEERLCEALGVSYISLFSNGTAALITALQALDLSGEVITTPYSFVATAHSLLWNHLTPVFVDIDPATFNLDPLGIERAITSNTSAILPVHCYGNPCKTSKIQSIADSFGLKVLYDAAHAFGVQDEGGSVLRHGDLSVLSFHATKVFNTFEGGAIVSHTPEMKQKVDRLKNFGYVDETTVHECGTNAKMSEVHAAFGLVQLEHMQSVLQKRKEAVEQYESLLKPVRGLQLTPFTATRNNYAYYPIRVLDSFECSRDTLYERMKASQVYPRRYFYPLMSSFEKYCQYPSADVLNLPQAHRVANEVLCLPLYPDVDVQRVVAAMQKD